MNTFEADNLVSIIVPVYNVQDRLNLCLDSLEKQTYKNLEIILVDDGSTDESGLICEKYAKISSQFKVFHKENSGVSSARNFGLKHCSGKWVSFADADDALHPDCIEKMLNTALEKNCEFVLCNYNVIDIQENNLDKKSPACDNSVHKIVLDKNFNYNKRGDFTHVWGTLISRRLALSEFFDESLAIGEDVLYASSVFSLAKTAYFINKPLYDYYIYENSAFHSNNYSEKRNTDVLAWEKTAQLHKNKQPLAFKHCRRCIGICSFNAAKRTMISLNYKAAKPFVKKMRKNIFHILFSDLMSIMKFHYIFICTLPRTAAKSLKLKNRER